MQLILGLFLIVGTAGAIAQHQNAASNAPLPPDAVRHSSSETSGSETALITSTVAATLPDAPSYTTQQPSGSGSTVQSERTLGIMTSSLAVDSRKTPLSPTSKRYFNLAMPNGVGGSPLIFVGGTLAGSEATDPHQQSDASVSGSAASCRGPADKNDGNGWMSSLLSVTSKSEHYCALGEGGFWKRGTYAASRAFAAHRYDGVNSFKASELFGPVIVPGLPAGYPYANYAGERLAARYASAVGRDALRNMFREFWPDISIHMLHRHP